MATSMQRQVLKRRRRDYMLKSAIATVKMSLHTVWTWLLTFLSLLTLPARKLRNKWRRKSSVASSTVGSDLSHLDGSISDDELFCTDVSINNNSIGALLDSSSSEASFHDQSPLEPYLSTLRQVRGLQDQQLVKMLSKDKQKVVFSSILFV